MKKLQEEYSYLRHVAIRANNSKLEKLHDIGVKALDELAKLFTRLTQAEAVNPKIPTMTHELSKAWDQPKAEDIRFSDLAVMETKTFKALKEYSSSEPSALYEGKMWKAYHALSENWYLCWCCPHPNDLNKIIIRRAQIKVVDEFLQAK